MVLAEGRILFSFFSVKSAESSGCSGSSSDTSEFASQDNQAEALATKPIVAEDFTEENLLDAVALLNRAILTE